MVTGISYKDARRSTGQQKASARSTVAQSPDVAVTVDANACAVAHVAPSAVGRTSVGLARPWGQNEHMSI